MTNRDETDVRPANKTKKTLFALGLGGFAGFLGAFGFMQLADSGAIGSLGESREIAALVAIIYLITAVAVLAGVFAPKAGATFLNVEDAEELREQKAMLGASGISMATSGAALLIAALAQPIGPIDGFVALALVFGLMAVATVLSITSQKHQDELMRAVGQQTGAYAFYLVFFIGGGWALAAHLGYVAAPAPLDWLTMFWGLGLLAAFIATARHGMLTMR